MTKCYVVFAGRQTGIFTEWEDCHASINGFSGNLYKSYPTRKQADEAFARYKNRPVVVARGRPDENISPSTHSSQSSRASSSTSWTSSPAPCSSSPTAAKALNKVISPIHAKSKVMEVVAPSTTKPPDQVTVGKSQQDAMESTEGESSISIGPISLKDVITKWKID
nr:ribonuclease H-like [Coffea arabica]